MKKTIYWLLLACLVLLPACSDIDEQIIPEHTEQFYVNDFADVIDYETENSIITYGRQLEELTGAQLVVLVVESLNDQPLEEFSLQVLRSWGIGQKDKDNGVLILLSVNDRKSRIEVGYGLEGALPDGKTGRIQDEYMLPYFKEGNYSKGILEGYKALLAEIYKEYGIRPGEEITATPYPLPADTEEDGNPIWIILGIIIILILDSIFLKGAIFRFIILLLSSNRRGGPGGGSGGWNSGRGSGGYSGHGRTGGGGSGGGGGSSRSW